MSRINLAFLIFVAAMTAGCGPEATRKSRAGFLRNLDQPQVDYRSTNWLDGRPKIIFDPENQSTGLTHDNLVRAWLRQSAESLGISPRLTDLRLERARRSAHGIHYEFIRPDGAGKIRNSVLIVSLTGDGSRIYRVYNGLAPKSSLIPEPTPKVTSKDALAAAWKFLNVTGELLAEPKVTFIRDSVNGEWGFWWLVNLETSTPAGSWELWIHPATGKVARQENRRLFIKDYDEAEAALKKRKVRKPASLLDTPTTKGSARLFVVDPPTALKDSSLKDDSPASTFDPAYDNVVLDGISQTSAGFHLEGARITLMDWDAPFTAVSTSPTGQWNQPRGNDSFNDVMTYYHLDQAVQYMENLGYKGESKIFEGALPADPNGFDGQDNSFFTPTINALSFGHGCVDDNEDPDVILHEMGHAINHAINPYFVDGDTGAMGEGFGDYWAVSYGFSDPRNREGDKFRVFNWDGSNSCWDGRRADRENARYKRGNTYHAHDRGSDGVISDEIWSTPLVMTLDELMTLGVPKSEVDLIVLESQYGLGHGIIMVDWANALVQTASMLYPTGPHKDVFVKRFKQHLIISPPSAELTIHGKAFGNAGNNRVPDPGEQIDLSLELFNIGDATAKDVTVEIKSLSEWATVANPVTSFGTLEQLKKSTGREPFKVTIAPNAPCGAVTSLEAHVHSQEGIDLSLPLEFPLGILDAGTDDFTSSPDAAVPDHDQNGLTDFIDINVSEGTQIRTGLSIDVAITHPSVTDVKITLISPSGHEIVLKSFLSGTRQDRDIIGNYPNTLHPVEELDVLSDQSINGRWQIKVVDGFEGGKGKLLAWSLHNPTGKAKCEKH
jgi:subtilisin-like proprotein convertase family protein